MFTNHMYSFTNNVYYYLTMCKQIAYVGLNYWCCVAVVEPFDCLQVGRLWLIWNIIY